MLYIEKGPCPDHIQAQIDRLTNTKQWRDMPEVPSDEQRKYLRARFNKVDKHDVRKALIAEQHGLCAYCMCRVSDDGQTTTIEHLVPLSKSKSGALSYANWLAACHGGRRSAPTDGPRRIMCCDAKKSNILIRLNPMNRAQMERIAYYEDGTVIYNAPADDAQAAITYDINHTLGLNGVVDPKTGHSRKDTSTGIVKQRKDTYIAMYDYLVSLADEGRLTPETIEAMRRELLSEDPWEPFVGVKLYVLDQFA